jgi:hypothetical protein
MKNRPPRQEKSPQPPPNVPVLTEIVHVDGSTIPGPLVVLKTQTDPAPAPAPTLTTSSDIASAMAKLGTQPEQQPAPLQDAEPAVPTEPIPQTHEHYIPLTSSGFSSSWWMTEQEETAALATPSPAPPQPLCETALVERILSGLQQQVGTMFEQRVREVVTPALAKVGETLLTDLHLQLSVNLRDMVVRAVANEVARTHPTDNG